MEYINFLIKSSFSDLRRNKVRTFLTSLGIMIGVLSVVLLIAFGIGLKNYIEQQFESLGTNLIYVLPGKVITEGGGFQDPGALAPRFDERDVRRMENIQGVAYVVPANENSATVTAGRNSETSQVISATENITRALNLNAEYGKLFTKADVSRKAKKAVIGPKLAEDLFGSASSAVGKSIRIGNQSFTVIGVTESKGGGALGGPNFDSITYIPIYASTKLSPEKKIYTLYVAANSEEIIPELKKDLEEMLLRRYEEDEFQVVEQTELLNIITSIFSIINSVLIAIGSISLIVGGIGIMNIMYATVTERIKEIGIRRAIGATKRNILVQFLTQALLLSLFGGLVGLILSWIIVLAIQPFFPAGISLFAVILAVGISSGIGIFFGVFPAKKAADLSPIEAIRYE